MHKSIFTMAFLGVLVLLASQVQGVIFADDYIYLYEDGEPVADNSIIITSHDNTFGETEVFEDIYTDGVFIRSQIETVNFTFYKANGSDLLQYPEWLHTNPNGTYEMYTESYISEQINESLYSININLPKPEDNKTYGHPFSFGGTIGSYRYFNIDIETGVINLTKAEKPETPGFELITVLCAIGLVLFLRWKNRF